MRIRSSTTAPRVCLFCLVLAGLCLFGVVSCSGPKNLTGGRGEAVDPRNPTPQGLGYRWREKEFTPVSASIPKLADAEELKDDDLCATCHEGIIKAHRTNIHREQSCETCHGPGSKHVKSRGKEPNTILSFKTMSPAERSEVCIKCHANDSCAPGNKWRTSAHAHAGVSCTDCHKSHYNLPPGVPATNVAQNLIEPGLGGMAVAENADLQKPIQPVGHQEAKYGEAKKDDIDWAAIRAASRSLGAADVGTCVRCHQKAAELLRVAHPHQVCGAVGMSCTTCHDPHGNIRKETRTDLCLQCHKGQPTMAWHSSVHSLNGVACVDCHNAHPWSKVPLVVDIRHEHINRPKRLPMAVDQPGTCYLCHQKIAAQFELPSHHPVREGKMDCSDCHDTHGQAQGNLREASLNLLCYRCHADKQGPFVWEHPPVTENCGYCHNAHGTVANNLLLQPTTFLCLRCHTGHRKDNRNPDLKWVDGRSNPTGIVMRAGHFTDCSQCHAQIHGSNTPTNTGRGNFFR